MDSYFDSPTLTSVIKQPLANDKNCEQLFDELFEKDNDKGDIEEELLVKRPKRTYQKSKRLANKIVRFNDENEHEEDDIDGYEDDNNDDDDDDDDDDNENQQNSLFKPKENKKKKQPRKKKLTYPNVSKDAVLEAFNKAIESQELPDFDEIEKFPLSIISESERKEMNEGKNKKSTRIKKNKQTKTIKKSICKNTSIIDKENEDVKQQASNVEKQLRRSNRKKCVLSEKSPNQENPDANNSFAKNLFDLNESCIPRTSRIDGDFTIKHDKNIGSQKGNKIQSSTPFMAIEKTIRNRSSRTRGKLFTNWSKK